MRRMIWATAAAAILLAGAPITIGPGPSQPVAIPAAEAAVRVSAFFSTLQPYGRWVRSDTYDYVWVPVRVDRNWAPYVHGHWVYTDRYGWYFVSNEPFAPIVYHYGRWGYDRHLGWFWVPGTKWAPAWVAWRRGDRHVGWAPLPPEGRGYAVDVNISININSIPFGRWFFVESNRFLDERIDRVAVRGDRDRELFRRSRPAGPVTVQNNIVINNVIDVDFIRQETKKDVPVRKVEAVDDPKAMTEERGDTIRAFVADVETPTAEDKPAEVVGKEEVEASPPPTSGAQESADAEAPKPADEPATAEGQPATDEGQTPATAEGQPPASDETQSPATAEGQTPASDEDQAPATAEGQPPASDEAQPPATAEGQTPASEAQPPSAREQEDCVDTDPDAEGCQPGDAAQQGQSNPTDEQATQPMQAEPRAEGDSRPQGNAGPSEETTGSIDSSDSAAPQRGDSNNAGAGNGGGEDRQNRAQSDGTSNRGDANERCRDDADPNQPGCQESRAE